MLSSGWESEDGLAWAPDGKEVWFTAAQGSATSRAIWAVDLAGKQRKILGIPGGIELQDIAQDGRVLATLENERLAMEWSGESESKTQDLSWYDWTLAKDISPDGQEVLFEESSEPAGPNYAVAMRKTDGSPPTRLGDGSVGSFSPDGKWALSVIMELPSTSACFLSEPESRSKFTCLTSSIFRIARRISYPTASGLSWWETAQPSAADIRG